MSSLRDLSWSKANEILESRYGTLALTGLDSTSSLADSYLDYYLPEEEENEEFNENRCKFLSGISQTSSALKR